MKLIDLIFVVLFCINSGSGQKDYGEPCSLRTQVANVFRGSESGEGCMTSKGLVCMNHKCICADPTNVYEVPTPEDDSSSSSSSASKIATGLIGFLKGDKNSQSTTTTTPSSTPTGSGGQTLTGGGGKCIGRAGSPCFTENSTCVQHAKCEGSPRLCKCQGIYGSNAQGRCSKTANIIGQVVKHVGK